MVRLQPENIVPVPPHDLELEAILLGCLLLGGRDDADVMIDVRSRLTPDAFYREAHAKIFAACLALFDRGEPIAPALVARELERRGVLEQVGGTDAIRDLCQSVVTPAHAAYYAVQLHDLAVRRGLIQACISTQQDALAGASGPDLLERLEQLLSGLHHHGGQAGPVHVREVLTPLLNDLQHPPAATPGLSTGLSDLDMVVGGLRPGQLIVVAGRTSMGKTTYGLNTARRACVESSVPTLIVTLEMSSREVLTNILAGAARVDAKHLHDPRFMRAAERERIAAAAECVEAAPLHLLDTSPMDLPMLRSHARRLRSRGHLGLIIVDYIQLLQGTGLPGVNRNTSREQEVAAISRALKSLAKEMDVPVLVLAQLNRMAESREGHRPRLSDLRESGAIENDADVVLLLFRPEYYTESEAQRDELRGLTEIIVAKQRNGPTGVVTAFFRAEQLRFDDLVQAAPSVRSHE